MMLTIEIHVTASLGRSSISLSCTLYLLTTFAKLYYLSDSYTSCFSWVLSKAKKEDTDDTIAKYDG